MTGAQLGLGFVDQENATVGTRLRCPDGHEAVVCTRPRVAPEKQRFRAAPLL